MDIGTYQAAAAMEMLEHWQDMTAMNVASMQKPGHKEMIPVMYASSPIKADKNSPNSVNSYIPECDSQVNFAPGSLEITDVPTHLALGEPNHFFELIDPEGNKVYTRDGTFHFNKDNQLVSASGYYKVSNNGSAPILQVNNGYPIHVSNNGKIQQGEQEIGTIGVFKLDPSNIEVTSGGYKLKKAKEAPAAQKFEVIQGALEMSNVKAPEQMTRMIHIQHHHDTNAESIKILDASLGKLIQNIYSS